ncbi:hypothetical protein [Streptomyces sp. NPDC012510]|uniref:hypothetical protein n=1 Tax=Streptomyces sp. NPDC012510 TaxID=3364838 RepID=UPI0036E1F45F
MGEEEALLRVEQFKEKLSSESSDRRVVDANILHGSCFAIQDDVHYSLKEEIATEFSLKVHQDIFVVGSAKLGFSISPKKRYRLFGDTSDIDIAIVSHDLYERVWHETHEYMESGAYWHSRRDFEKYLAWGWIRPDKLPGGPTFKFTDTWWNFFRSLQQSRRYGPYKIAAAVYHDMSFLAKYQMGAVAACRGDEKGKE